MATLTLKVTVDPKTRARSITVDLQSDPDALPHEHEEHHADLVRKLGLPKGVRASGPAPAVSPQAIPAEREAVPQKG